MWFVYLGNDLILQTRMQASLFQGLIYPHLFIHLFILSVNKSLSNTYHVPLSMWDIAVTKTDKNPNFHSLTICKGSHHCLSLMRAVKRGTQ